MRIAIASDLCLSMTNGVAVFAKTLAEGLAKTGHEVLVLCPSPTTKAHQKIEKVGKTGKITYAYLTSMRLPVYPDQIHKIPEQPELWGHKLPRFAYKNGLLWSPWPGRQVKKALDKFRPDIIHNQTAETVALAVLSYARRRGVPLISTGHAFPDNITSQIALINTRPLFWAKKSLDQVLKWWMNSFLKHSEYATMPTQLAIDNLLPKNRRHFPVPVEALSNGIDLSAFHPGGVAKAVRVKYRLPTGIPTVLYVGRVDGEKSVDKIVTAFVQVLAKIPEARLVIVGDGIAKAGLEKMVAELGIAKNVHFLGKVLPPDIHDLYRAGDVFATASETETQGIVLIEAAATGLPLVAVNKGAVSELCQNGHNGYLCEAGDTAGIAKAIVKILKKPALRAKFSENSLQIASKHDFRRTLARFVQIYQTAIDLKAEKK